MPHSMFTITRRVNPQKLLGVYPWPNPGFLNGVGTQISSDAFYALSTSCFESAEAAELLSESDRHFVTPRRAVLPICIVRWERLTSVVMCYTTTLLRASTHLHRNPWNSDFWHNGSPNIGYHNTAAHFLSQEEYSNGTTVCVESNTSLLGLVSAWF